MMTYLGNEPAWLSHQCQRGDKLSSFIMEAFGNLHSGISMHVWDLGQSCMHLQKNTRGANNGTHLQASNCGLTCWNLVPLTHKLTTGPLSIILTMSDMLIYLSSSITLSIHSIFVMPWSEKSTMLTWFNMFFSCKKNKNKNNPMHRGCEWQLINDWEKREVNLYL